jgi:outer membrane lipopolysaccharide assembly protein LptE/RlpB
MKKLTWIPVLVLLIGMIGCGYKLTGFNTQIPSYIKNISIPDFDNKSVRYQVDQYITYAVKEEFIKRSNLVLVDKTEGADSMLEGIIKRFEVKPISYSNDASGNLYKVTIEVSVRFIDLKNNKVIFEGEGITFSGNYEIESSDFFSQETQTLIKISEECADSVVTTILENF